MILSLNPDTFDLKERSFIIRDEDVEDGLTISVEIHPWDRKSPAVAVAVTYDYEDEDSPEREHLLQIVDRDLFVEGILFAFPELRRA